MQAEIVTIEVRDDKIVSAVMKAPGLPDGFHDLFCDSGKDRIAEVENIARLAREYVDAELQDDPTIADEGTALHDLAQALAAS